MLRCSPLTVPGRVVRPGMGDDRGGQRGLAQPGKAMTEVPPGGAQIPDQTSAAEDGRWLTPGVVGVGAASFFSDSGHEITTAVLPSFLTSTLHASAGVLGVIEGVSDALTGVMKLVGGPLADDPAARRRLAAGGYLGTAVATGAIGLAATVWQAGALRAVAWLSRGLRSPARDSLLASLAPRSAYGRAFGVERAGDNLGAVAGPLLAAGLVAWLGIRPAMLLAVVPGLFAAAAIVVAAREARRTVAAGGGGGGGRRRLDLAAGRAGPGAAADSPVRAGQCGDHAVDPAGHPAADRRGAVGAGRGVAGDPDLRRAQRRGGAGVRAGWTVGGPVRAPDRAGRDRGVGAGGAVAAGPAAGQRLRRAGRGPVGRGPARLGVGRHPVRGGVPGGRLRLRGRLDGAVGHRVGGDPTGRRGPVAQVSAGESGPASRRAAVRWRCVRGDPPLAGRWRSPFSTALPTISSVLMPARSGAPQVTPAGCRRADHPDRGDHDVAGRSRASGVDRLAARCRATAIVAFGAQSDVRDRADCRPDRDGRVRGVPYDVLARTAGWCLWPHTVEAANTATVDCRPRLPRTRVPAGTGYGDRWWRRRQALDGAPDRPGRRPGAGLAPALPGVGFAAGVAGDPDHRHRARPVRVGLVAVRGSGLPRTAVSGTGQSNSSPRNPPRRRRCLS